MLKQLFNTVGRVLRFIGSLILAAIMVVVTWAFWGYYQDITLQKKFTQEGQLRTVTVNQATYNQQSWRDVLTNTAYLTFQDRGKTYATRYTVGPGYIGSGDRVQLYYHPDYDSFQQPFTETHPDVSARESRLVRWSMISTFRMENKLLLLCLVLTTVSFFLVSGVIVTLVPIPFLQVIARFLVMLIMLIVSVYFTYDTYEYFQYYQHLKTNSRDVSVQVLSTDRRRQWRSTHSRHDLTDPIYYYQATVQYENQKRIIAISQSDFKILKPGATLQALYDESFDDLMSANFPPNYWLLAVPIFFWIVTLVLVRASLMSRQKN